MKKISKILLGCLSLFLLCSVFTFSVHAEEVSDECLNLDVINERNEKLIDFLREQDSKDVDKVVRDFYNKNPKYSEEILSQEKLSFKQKRNMTSNFNSIDNKLIIEKKVDINDEQTVYFYKNGTYMIETLDSRVINNLTRSASKYKRASNTHNYYNVLGGKSLSISIESDFGYDGNKAWISGKPTGKYDKGILTIWQVENWEVGGKSINDGEYARAYAEGYFHFGAEYKGFGIVIQDLNADCRVSVTRDGKVFKNDAPEVN